MKFESEFTQPTHEKTSEYDDVLFAQYKELALSDKKISTAIQETSISLKNLVDKHGHTEAKELDQYQDLKKTNFLPFSMKMML